MKTTIKNYVSLALADRLVAKSAGISEVTQIGRGEKRTRSFLNNAWDRRAKQATKKAVSLAKSLKSPKIISNEVNAIMERWKTDVLSVFATEFGIAYRLGRFVGFKKATKQIKGSLEYGLPKEVEKADVAELLPSFDLVDQENLKALTKHQTFWIGDFYKKNVSDAIAETTKEVMVIAGGGSAAAGRLMNERISENFKHVKIPKGFIGTPKQYFSGLTANAFTVARVHGQVRSFAEIGITTYTITNPADKRTCSRCAHMDGKRFTTRQGVDQMHKELAVDTKQGVKDVHPWLSLKEIQKISPKPGFVGGKVGDKDAKALSEHGQALPPYHFKCRCTVDVSTESSTYSNLIPLTPPTPKKISRVLETKPPGKTFIQNDKISQMLRTGIVNKTSTKNIGGRKTKLLEMKTHDNKKVSALWKPIKEHNEETAYYRLDREIAGKIIVPATISRDPGIKEGIGVVQQYEKEWKQIYEASEYENKRIRLLDFLSGKGTRRNGDLFKTKQGVVVLNNNDSFKIKSPKKYFFPTKLKEKDLNKIDLENLKKIKLSRIVNILQEENIPKKSARLVLLRVLTLKNDPKILTKKNTTEIWEILEKEPSKLIKSNDIAKIDKVLKHVYDK